MFNSTATSHVLMLLLQIVLDMLLYWINLSHLLTFTFQKNFPNN